MTMSERIACSLALSLWLRRFFQLQHVMARPNEDALVHYDSMIALPYTKDPKCHSRTKHMIFDITTFKMLFYMKGGASAYIYFLLQIF